MLDMANVDFSGRKYVLSGPSASGGMVSLESLELLLAEHAVALGVTLKRGTEVTNFTENENGITVHSGEESFAGSWLVGCDGGRSAVRKLAGFEFAGTEPEFTGYTASVKMVDPEKLRPGFNLTETGMYINGPGPDRIGLLEFDDASFDRTTTVTLENLQAVLRRVSGTDVTLASMSVASTYTDRARQATTYRKGRVLLAGDAAHVHSPLGGQGLNTGLGDAMNLGWKLAATINGWAPAGLLDTYTAERHPLGAWVQDWTLAQTALSRKDPHTRALHSIVADLLGSTHATMYVLKKISGVATRLDLPGEHPLIGRVVPDLPLPDGTVAGQHLDSAHYLLLGGSPRSYPDLAGRLRVLATGEPGAVLVRPDGYVALASEEGLAEAEVRAHLS